MTGYEALVLAAAPASDPSIGEPLSAMIPVHAKPALDWVISTLAKCGSIEKITVLGPEILDELLCMRHIHRRITPGLFNISALSTQTGDTGTVSGYILLAGDLVLLTPGSIDTLLESIPHEPNGIIIPSISAGAVTLPIPSSLYNTGADGGYRANLAVVREPQWAIAAFRRLSLLHRANDPLRGAGPLIGLAAALNNRISGADTVSPALDKQEFCFRVTSATEKKIAEQVLENPWRRRYGRVKLIVNPFSGLGPELPAFLRKLIGIRKRKPRGITTPQQYTDRIVSILNEFDIHPEPSITAKATEAAALARQCAQQDFDCVIAAGGDGTINGVINGLAGSPTPMAVIPIGTVNVFALQFRIPMEIRSACQLAAEGTIRNIDLGKADQKYFSCLAGVGFDAYVIARVNRRFKKLMGAFTYALIGLASLIRYPFRSVLFTLDDSRQIRNGYLVIVANGRYYTSNVVIDGGADPTDGYLDTVIFRRKDAGSIIRNVLKLPEGTLSGLEGVEHVQVKAIHFLRHGHHHVHLDGDYTGRTPMNISVEPLALKVIY